MKKCSKFLNMLEGLEKLSADTLNKQIDMSLRDHFGFRDDKGVLEVAFVANVKTPDQKDLDRFVRAFYHLVTGQWEEDFNSRHVSTIKTLTAGVLNIQMDNEVVNPTLSLNQIRDVESTFKRLQMFA
jgi:hypothetical protein